MTTTPDYSDLAHLNGRNPTYETNERNEETPPGHGLSSSDSFLSSTERPWPELDPAALHGPCGELVNLLDPHTEADTAAVLVTFLATWGGIVGSGPHAVGGNTRHPARVAAVIVGNTAKARKGTSWAVLRPVLERIDPTFLASRVLGGFGSGEAVVDEVRDANPDDDEDRGSPDKRLLIHEPEFAKVLKVCARETSILSTVIRDAWDGSRLQTRARAKKAVASDHHVVIVGHVTAPELRRNLTETEIAGGFANRLLWICAERSKRLPFDSSPDQAELAPLVDVIAQRCRDARKAGRVGFADDAAKARWAALYEEMADDDPGGMLGAIVARPEPHTLRLALTYALLDGAAAIGVHHIDAAYAVWSYSRASAAYVFGDAIGDQVADTLLKAIRDAGPEGLDLTQQSALFSRNVKAPRLAAARADLEDRGLIETVSVPPDGGRGRPKQISRALEADR